MRPSPAFRGLAYAALTLVAFTFLEPLTWAQGAPPLVQVSVQGEPSHFTIRKSHGSATLYFNVSFACQSGQGYGACSGQAGETDVLVTLQHARDFPPGWEVKYTPDESSKRVKAKEAIPVTVTVRLLDDEPQEDRFPVDLSATAQPVTNSQLDPLLGSQLGQSSSDSDTIEMDKILNTGEQLTSWARAYMWPLLGAAVILLVAGVVLVERKKGALNLASDAPSQSVVAGRGTSFPVRVANDSKHDDRVSLSVGNLPPEWTAIMPLSELDLRPGERTQMWITLRAPSEAIPGQSVSFALRARSSRGQRATDLPLHVTVVAGGSQPSVEVTTPPPPPPIEFSQETVEAPPTRRRRFTKG